MFEDSSRDYLYKDLYSKDEAPPHPGEVLRDDVFPKLAMTRKALAAALGIGPRKLSDLMGERRPVTWDLALRLGVVLGHGSRYWLGLQAQHDMWRVMQPVPSGFDLKPLSKSKTSGATGARMGR